ncbi:MAG TPA: SGNH/GDSL hydrolase family protein [Pyrinomonadaceae bacterium]|nr:SGNH/GDSL hydrolase family protein [Pyrinomonadaceae bacterium]
MTYRAFGDSITDGTGASGEASKWRNVLGTALGVSITSFAHGGDMVGDQTNEVYSVQPVAGDVSLISLGVNDQRIYGANTVKQAYFRDGLRNHIAWLALGSKQTARSVGGEAGVWSNTGILGIGRASTSVGSTKTFTLEGTAVYVSLILADSAGANGPYEISIDGGSPQSFNSNAPGVTSYNGYPYNERLHRFAGLSSGTHTLQVKMTGPSNLYVQWAAGNAQTVKPKVFVGNVIKANGYQWGGSEANVLAYNVDIAAVVAELAADGLDVTLVDLCSVVNPASDLHPADGLHPADSGHAKIAEAFRLAITGQQSPPEEPPITYQTATLLKGSDGVFYVDVGGTISPF